MLAIKRLCRYSILVVAVLFISGCAAAPISPPRTPSALDTYGPGAARLAEHWWVMLAIGTAIWVLVVGLLFAALLRRRRAGSETPADSRGGDTGRRWVMWGGLALPLIVLAVVFGHSIYTLAQVENPRGQPAVRIHVVAERWWWEVQYPDQGVTTANEIHLPVGLPVEIQLEARDVIHSFWVPQLHGKMDAIPTRVNYITLQADQAGVYRGECAEFCGLQHAHMGFMVVAQSNDDFRSWLAAQQKPAPPPAGDAAQQGQQVFMSAGCVFCHYVNGLEDKRLDRSSIDLGPDLTHLASRLTIAGADRIENRGNMAGWIVDAQHIKPGNLMPNMELNSQDLQALLAYLETLR